jgi:hypothetical protein
MVNDQATALRELKRRFETEQADGVLNRDEFLAHLPRPTPFLTVALIIPTKLGPLLPPLQHWALQLLGGNPRACAWDQGGLLAAGTALMGSPEGTGPVLQSVETSQGPLLVLPRWGDLPSLTRRPEADRLRFVRHLVRHVSPLAECWITLPAEDLPAMQAILHATDGACIVVPEHPEAVLRGYEAAKSVHLSGYFAPISLLPFYSDRPPIEGSIERRIRAVAKQFLSLDLLPAGMVLSGNTFVPPLETEHLRSRMTAAGMEARDFLYSLAERLAYPMPGERG